MDLVEQLGSGIPRILQTYGEECFYFSENFIRMSFPAEKVVEKVVEKISENQMKIVELMNQDSSISALQISKEIGISQRKTQENIAKLKELEVIERIGSAKGGYWKVLKKS